jgi:hypothetical protein
VIGGGLMMLGHKSESAVATPHVINKHPFGVKKHATTATKKTTKQAATTKPKPQPVQATPAKAPEQPSAVIAALAAGMPAPIAKALGKHPIVVVSLYNPYSEVDGIAFAEARAGAQMAKVGFLPLSVLSQAQVGKLTEQLGLLPDPGLLVYARPGNLVARISGFADKETVAQAAQNAARGT